MTTNLQILMDSLTTEPDTNDSVMLAYASLVQSGARPTITVGSYSGELFIWVAGQVGLMNSKSRWLCEGVRVWVDDTQLNFAIHTKKGENGYIKISASAINPDIVEAVLRSTLGVL